MQKCLSKSPSSAFKHGKLQQVNRKPVGLGLCLMLNGSAVLTVFSFVVSAPFCPSVSPLLFLVFCLRFFGFRCVCCIQWSTKVKVFFGWPPSTLESCLPPKKSSPSYLFAGMCLMPFTATVSIYARGIGKFSLLCPSICSVSCSLFFLPPLLFLIVCKAEFENKRLDICWFWFWVSER